MIIKVYLFDAFSSMMSKEVFEGTEGNLLRLFEKNRNIVMSLKELPLDATASDK